MHNLPNAWLRMFKVAEVGWCECFSFVSIDSVGVIIVYRYFFRKAVDSIAPRIKEAVHESSARAPQDISVGIHVSISICLIMKSQWIIQFQFRLTNNSYDRMINMSSLISMHIVYTNLHKIYMYK